MPKRERAQRHTVASQIEQFRARSTPIEPTQRLTKAERTYFDQIITDREAASWSPNHLTIATHLARTYASIDDLWEIIKREGYTVANERGTVVQHAALTSLNTMTQAMQALNRTLGLSASQRGLAGAKQGERNRTEREVEDLNASANKRSLLA